MSELAGQIAVVGEQEQALAVVIQSAHGIEPHGKIPKLVQHGSPAFRVGYGGHFPGGLVVHDVAFLRFRQGRAPVHPHVLSRFHLRAHVADDLSIHGDAPFGHQFFGRTPRSHAARRQILL